MLASCPALSKDTERVCIPPKITQQLGRLAFQRLDALWCSSQGSTPLSFYRYYRGALKFARFVRAEHSADVCPHPHCISLWKPPFRTTASREGSLSAQEECSSCNKKRGCLVTCTPKKKLDLLLKCNPFTPQPADGSGIVQNRPLPLLWGGIFFFQAQEPTEPQGSDHREASSPD